MRWLLLLLLLAGCSPSAPPATPTPAPSAAAGPGWIVTYGETDHGVTIASDGSVRAHDKVVGNIPPAELHAFDGALHAPELAAVKLEATPAEHVVSLAWKEGETEKRWSWPATSGDLPAPLARAVDELEKAQANMVPVP